MKKRIYIYLIILLIIIGSTFAYYASNYSGVVTTKSKTFNISVDITGRQGMETEYAINYIGFENSTQYPSVINKDDEIIIDMSKYNYTSLNLKQGENDLSLDTHYTYENGILKLHNIIDDVPITNLTSFCTRYNKFKRMFNCNRLFKF